MSCSVHVVHLSTSIAVTPWHRRNHKTHPRIPELDDTFDWYQTTSEPSQSETMNTSWKFSFIIKAFLIWYKEIFQSISLKTTFSSGFPYSNVIIYQRFLVIITPKIGIVTRWFAFVFVYIKKFKLCRHCKLKWDVCYLRWYLMALQSQSWEMVSVY